MGASAVTAERNATYDVLRGLAILTMLAANVVGYVSPAGEHPFWLRVYGSFAAPLFITLAGLVGALGVRRKGHGFSYYLKRGLLIIATGALIDVGIWQVLPFTTYDVLYLIGFAFVLLCFFEKLGLAWKSVGVLLIFAAGPVLVHYLGYADYPSEYDLAGELTMEIENETPIWQHWLVDGWFPVFPWLGFALMGSVMLDARDRLKSFRRWQVLAASLAAVVAGAILLWQLSLGEILAERGCYSELFYPPTAGYIVLAAGATWLLAAVIDGSGDHGAFFPLRILGQASMFIYILHTALVQFVILPYFADPETEEASGTLGQSLLVYALVTLASFLTALGLYHLKKHWKVRSFFFRFYFGG